MGFGSGLKLIMKGRHDSRKLAKNNQGSKRIFKRVRTIRGAMGERGGGDRLSLTSMRHPSENIK